VSSSGTVRDAMDVGPFESEILVVVEVDRHGRCRRSEWFAPDRLDAAIARIYERYAELVRGGPERARAATIARAVSRWVGPFELEAAASVLAPAVESVDHRILGTWSVAGKDALLAHLHALVTVAEGVVVREDDVLALRHDALLVRCTHCGTDRASGGPYERPHLMLLGLGGDGLVTRFEWFDLDRDAEALARFDALAASEARAPRFASAATR
jgi:hypothetical protein